MGALLQPGPKTINTAVATIRFIPGVYQSQRPKQGQSPVTRALTRAVPSLILAI